MPATPTAVGIIGPGRAGTGLALALANVGYVVRLYGRRAVPVPPPLTLTVGRADSPPPWLADTPVVICAVPDGAIGHLAAHLASDRAVGPQHVVLHLSGVREWDVLDRLASCGAALGSLHPLQTLVDPRDAPARLRGAWAAVEGMELAVVVAERIARDVGLRPFRIPRGTKARYHAGAVFASNYLVVIEAVAQRLLRDAGLTDAEAWQALRPLVEGTLENLAMSGPIGALTGPVARGDSDTIRRHRAALGRDSKWDEVQLYALLGRAALQLARAGGMDEETARRVAEALATDPPRERPSGA